MHAPKLFLQFQQVNIDGHTRKMEAIAFSIAETGA
jgi:hypothetical protein